MSTPYRDGVDIDLSTQHLMVYMDVIIMSKTINTIKPDFNPKTPAGKTRKQCYHMN